MLYRFGDYEVDESRRVLLGRGPEQRVVAIQTARRGTRSAVAGLERVG